MQILSILDPKYSKPSPYCRLSSLTNCKQHPFVIFLDIPSHFLVRALPGTSHHSWRPHFNSLIYHLSDDVFDGVSAYNFAGFVFAHLWWCIYDKWWMYFWRCCFYITLTVLLLHTLERIALAYTSDGVVSEYSWTGLPLHILLTVLLLHNFSLCCFCIYFGRCCLGIYFARCCTGIYLHGVAWASLLIVLPLHNFHGVAFVSLSWGCTCITLTVLSLYITFMGSLLHEFHWVAFASLSRGCTCMTLTALHMHNFHRIAFASLSWGCLCIYFWRCGCFKSCSAGTLDTILHQVQVISSHIPPNCPKHGLFYHMCHQIWVFWPCLASEINVNLSQTRQYIWNTTIYFKHDDISETQQHWIQCIWNAAIYLKHEHVDQSTRNTSTSASINLKHSDFNLLDCNLYETLYLKREHMLPVCTCMSFACCMH